MARGRSTFRLRDVARALRAAAAAGMSVQRYEIDKDGKIVVVMAGEALSEPEKCRGVNEWDAV